LTIKNVQGVKSISKDFENELQIYIKLLTVLYADDTVLLAESIEETLALKNNPHPLELTPLVHCNTNQYFSIWVERSELYPLTEICLKGALIKTNYNP
jgi:hypothetical protein